MKMTPEDRRDIRASLNRRRIFLENALAKQGADGGHIQALNSEIDLVDRQLEALEEEEQ